MKKNIKEYKTEDGAYQIDKLIGSTILYRSDKGDYDYSTCQKIIQAEILDLYVESDSSLFFKLKDGLDSNIRWLIIKIEDIIFVEEKDKSEVGRQGISMNDQMREIYKKSVKYPSWPTADDMRPICSKDFTRQEYTNEYDSSWEQREAIREAKNNFDQF